MLVTAISSTPCEAQRRGLINRGGAGRPAVDEEVGCLATSILAKSPVAIRAGKADVLQQVEMA